jgi:thymidylate synthase/dihydrofolate reductase
MSKFNIITAYLRSNRGIGFQGKLPWNGQFREDLKYFKAITTRSNVIEQRKSVIIMGKNTYKSLPKLLPDRYNVVITSKPHNLHIHTVETPFICKSLNDALQLEFPNKCGELFVIGGQQLYTEAITHPMCSNLYITEINDLKDDNKKDDECSVTSVDNPMNVGISGYCSVGLHKEIQQHIKDGNSNGNGERDPFLYIDKQKNLNSHKYQQFEVDTYFPDIPEYFKLSTTNICPTDDHLNFSVYINNNLLNVPSTKKLYHNNRQIETEEGKYLKLLQEILDEGEVIEDRTGTGCISVFDKQISFNINVMNPDCINDNKLVYQIPMLTTKKIHLRSIVYELIFFLSGNVDTKWLEDRKVNIWKGNTSRQFLDSRGLETLPEGSIGKGYSHQWTNFGGSEIGDSKGINQIEEIIRLLKDNPTNRRILLSAWNPYDLKDMALPPCHILYMFKVTGHKNTKKTLNCKMIMRSSDTFLGLPFNILSTAFLTIMISRIVGMLPGRVTISTCDSHIYMNHVEQVKTQLGREPFEFPTMTINKDIKKYEDMIGLELVDFKVNNYKCHPGIKAPMAV